MKGRDMAIAQTRCASCEKPLKIQRLACSTCDTILEGAFDFPPLARLNLEDQVFVTAFLRHHGSIRRMEAEFSISYPTIKKRLHRIVRELDAQLDAPTPNQVVLDRLAKGELTVDEALRLLQ